MKYYYYLQNKKVFLWGNTYFTSKIYSCLVREGIEPIGIIEKNNSTINELHIYNFDEIKGLDYDKEEIVFILCLKSSLNQEKLARDIYDNGYKNIVFAPLTMCNTGASYHMRSNYEYLMYGEVKNLLFPTYDALSEQDYEYRIVKYMKDFVEVNVAIRYIRTFYRESVSEELLPFRDKPISEYDYLNELYDYFYNNRDYPINYMDIYMHGAKDDTFLADRKKLFDTFRIGYESLGIAFFESMPIPVEIKENGLNIKDGMHRASFLYKFGISMFPVIMTIDDFEEFVNRVSEERYR